MPKHSPRSTFREALAAVARGETYLPADFVEAEGEEGDAGDAVERLSTLTAQQSRILQLICQGKLNKQIAHDLDIAETTVKAHITAILRKLGVHSRTQAVLIAQNARYRNILRDAPGVS